MPLTLEIPDDLARQLEGMTEEERSRFVMAALSYGMDHLPLSEAREEGEPDPESVAAIQEAVAIGLDKSATLSLATFARNLGIDR